MGAGIALQSAARDVRIEAVVAEASFANLTEAAYDYAGFRRSPLLGKTFLAPGAWTVVYRGQSLAGFPAAEVSPEKAVASRAFPVLLLCDADDVALPCRHTQMIYAAARGRKQIWVVPGAAHSAALGRYPAEFQHRVLAFYDSVCQDPFSRFPEQEGRVLEPELSTAFGLPSISVLPSLAKIWVLWIIGGPAAGTPRGTRWKFSVESGCSLQ